MTYIFYIYIIFAKLLLTMYNSIAKMKRNYRSNVCLRNVFTSRREYLSSSLLSLLGRSTLVPSRTQQGWIRSGMSGNGGSRTLEISFIMAGTVNLRRIDTMIVHRRHDASLAAHPPWSRRCSSFDLCRMFRRNIVN